MEKAIIFADLRTPFGSMFSPLRSLSFSLTCPEALVGPLLTHCSSAHTHTHQHTPRVEKEVVEQEEEKGRRRLPLKCAGDVYPLFKCDI